MFTRLLLDFNDLSIITNMQFLHFKDLGVVCASCVFLKHFPHLCLKQNFCLIFFFLIDACLRNVFGGPQRHGEEEKYWKLFRSLASLTMDAAPKTHWSESLGIKII